MRKHSLKFASLLGIALAVALFAPQRAAADDDDPPSRVARLSYAHGTVSFPGGHRRLGFRGRQPSDYHWRQALDRQRRPRRAAHWLRGNPSFQQHWFFVSESGRPHGPDPPYRRHP